MREANVGFLSVLGRADGVVTSGLGGAPLRPRFG